MRARLPVPSRNAVRDLLIRVRRRAATPHKVKIGLIEDQRESLCSDFLMNYPESEHKNLGDYCEVFIEELDDESGTKLLKFLKAGPAEWSDALDSEGAQKDICSDMCDADEL